MACIQQRFACRPDNSFKWYAFRVNGIWIYVLSAWRYKDKTFRLRNSKHKRFNFKLRAPANNREKINTKYSSKLPNHIQGILLKVTREKSKKYDVRRLCHCFRLFKKFKVCHNSHEKISQKLRRVCRGRTVIPFCQRFVTVFGNPKGVPGVSAGDSLNQMLNKPSSENIKDNILESVCC